MSSEELFPTSEIGSAATVKSGFAFKSKDWADDGVPVVKIANVKSGRLAMDGCSFVSEETASSASEYLLSDGDIVIGMTGDVGEVALVRDDARRLLNQRVGRFSITRPEALDGRFLFYTLLSPRARQSLLNAAHGSVQSNISPQLIEEIEIYLPPLPDQRRIAWVLGALDDKIELNRKMARTLEETAAAIFKARFVDFEGIEEFEDSEIGPIPKGWKVTSLGTFPGLSIVKPGLDSERYGVTDAPLDYVATGDVSGHAITGSDQVDLDTKPSRANMQPGFDRVWFAKMKASTKYLWTMRVHDAYWKSKILSTGFAGLQADTHELASFLFGLISSEEFEARKDQGATGTTMEAVNNDWINNYPVLTPPTPILQEFDRRIRPLMTQYWSNLIECQTLAALRDELLPKLISGKIRVPEGVRPELDQETAQEVAEELTEA